MHELLMGRAEGPTRRSDDDRVRNPAGFLAIAIIVALFFLRNVLRSMFSKAASSVSNAPG
jgi:hypothetical protein